MTHLSRGLRRLACALAAAILPFVVQAEGAASGAAASPDARFEEALRASRSALLVTDGALSGPGAAVLRQAIAPARFVLLGEDHASREIPRFTEVVCDLLRPDAYAVEADPEAARFVEAHLHRPDRLARTAERLRRHPSDMVVLDLREESELAAQCATTSRRAGFQLWGLDQPFLGAAGSLLEAMAVSPGGHQARNAVATAQAAERRAAAAALASGNPMDAFLAGAPEADIAALRAGVLADGSATARRLLGELLTSREIYRGGGHDANRQRALLMKRHFLARYGPLKARLPDARVLVKLGDVHVQQGLNALSQRDIGNLVAELADAEETQSLHLFVYGARGVHALYDGYGRPFRHAPFVLGDDPDDAWLAPALAAALPQDADTTATATVFDLRQLRFRGLPLPPTWRQVIFATDLFVLLPELTPATPVE